MRFWRRTGTGAGAPCPVCGETVTKDQLEFEIEFARDGDDLVVPPSAESSSAYDAMVAPLESGLSGGSEPLALG